nr:glutamic acid-rich protein-like isoform X1 [Zootoca vivipara]XP_034967847.1 glutamic acid-rich protein-like isoform X1 [Zootoca vivipara]XP_034967848.1 glutamic acid-rich protein-like isoform X1 [Zootoca vivipara]XP_034967849.1 glutamic acid-rich protein-like isoform X1 [Zootoca vivipara]XP_034967850.1 glutamic acid-rich protein-like isoform X1 [Zootoca vivipara]XP_034967852.1 glutamic acid-rich protein-like isoform X1 [Zootoca vivipara]XP_034967853.1 glutamic acid-rich protein-like isofor
MRMAGKEEKKAASTPKDRRGSKQEEVKDLEALWQKIKDEFKHSEQRMDKKLGEIDKKIEGAVGELSIQIKDLSVRSKTMEESIKKTQKDVKEVKKETDKVKDKMKKMDRAHEQMLDNLALIEMKQRQLNLKLRGIPEESGEDIKSRIIAELAKWMGKTDEEVSQTIVNAFRIKVKSAKAKARKAPGDCVVIFNTMEMKNEILSLSFTNKLIIGGKPIIVFKEIPGRFLKKRDNYKAMVALLKKNGIQHRWEYPEGMMFFYKEKRHVLTSMHDIGKFLRKYEIFLGELEPDLAVLAEATAEEEEEPRPQRRRGKKKEEDEEKSEEEDQRKEEEEDKESESEEEEEEDKDLSKKPDQD